MRLARGQQALPVRTTIALNELVKREGSGELLRMY